MTVSLRLVPAPVRLRERCALCQERRFPWLGQELCQRFERDVRAAARERAVPTTYV
jgi:hypothetical protein